VYCNTELPNHNLCWKDVVYGHFIYSYLQFITYNTSFSHDETLSYLTARVNKDVDEVTPLFAKFCTDYETNHSKLPLPFYTTWKNWADHVGKHFGYLHRSLVGLKSMVKVNLAEIKAKKFEVYLFGKEMVNFLAEWQSSPKILEEKTFPEIKDMNERLKKLENTVFNSFFFLTYLLIFIPERMSYCNTSGVDI